MTGSGAPSAEAAAGTRALFEEGVRLHQARRLSEAQALYERVLRERPGHPGALHLMGVLDIQRGEPAAAVGKIGAAIAANPGAAPFHGNLGTALQALGRLDEAQKSYEQAVRLDRRYADAHNNLGALHEKRQRWREAAASYRAAIAARPEFPEAHNNLGHLLRKSGALEESAKHFLEALRLRPDYGDAHRGHGMVLARQDKHDEAIACFRRAIELDPRDAEAHNQLGSRLKHLGRLADAEASFRAAIAIRDDFPEAHNNLGNTFFRQGRLDEAEACYRKALELRPNYADGFGNLGIVLMGRCRHEEAVAHFRKALELRPVYHEAVSNMSQALLTLGQFREGWERYEARWKLAVLPPRPFRQPWWRGESIVGQTILLHAEQGLGDTLQFLRYVPIVRALGADVVVEIQPELLRLAAPLARPGIRLVQRGNPLPHFDVHCPLLSIPGVLACELDTIPPPGDELAPDPELVRAWKERLGQGGDLRVGLVWAGNPQHGNDHHRSFRPLAFGPLLEVPGVRFFSMQKNRREGDDADLARLGRIEDIAPLLTDFAESAAALCALDLLVAADTSIVHLAGAIRRPVWTMVPFSPDWRWMLGRDDTPWYPSMRLFRQPRQRDWKSVFARVAAELALLRR